MTTKASVPYPAFTFEAGDIVMAGRESSGVPDEVHAAAFGRVCDTDARWFKVPECGERHSDDCR